MLFDLGVLVFQFSLNSDDAQGFTMPEGSFGVVGLCTKNEDPVVRCFSLFHEVCHLCLGKPGVSGGETIFMRRPSGQREMIEVFCNRFAAAFLLPLRDEQVSLNLKSILDKRTGIDKSRTIEMARKFKVSKYVVLFRAREAGYLSWDSCVRINSEWQEEDKEIGDRRNSDDQKNKHRGPSALVLRVSERGKRFTSLVFEALDTGRISLHEAANYLSLQPKDFDDVRERAGRGRL